MPHFTTLSGGIAMVPTLFFYELGLIALVWLFLLLCWLGPNATAVWRQPIAPSKPLRRKRSTVPKAFAGLTTKELANNKFPIQVHSGTAR
jgi:hypothetical protein